jgi:phage terminase Nu1 subunit (DNA packaging protein)
MTSKATPLTIGGETLFPQAQVADMLGCTVRTLEQWRQSRVGPAWTKVGHRVYYREKALESWIRAQERHPVAGRAA